MRDLKDKATAWDAVAEKNARIADLERDLAAARRCLAQADAMVTDGIANIKDSAVSGWLIRLRAIIRGDPDAC